MFVFVYMAVLIINIISWGIVGYILYLVIKALRKYVNKQ